MKSIVLIAISLFVGLAFCQTNVQTRSIAGGVDAGGGNADVAEFYTIARSISIHYQDTGSRTSLSMKSMLLVDLVKSMKVEEVTHKLYLNNQYVEAINYPTENKIQFDASAWREKDNFKKTQLVIHELLGLLRVPDLNYKLSLEILSEMYSDGLDFNKGLEQLLKYNRPFKLKMVECKIYKNYVYVPFKTFKLTECAGGLCERVLILKNIYVEVFFGYGPRVQNRIDVYTKLSPNAPITEAIGGKKIATTMSNYIGDTIDLHLETGNLKISCESAQ